MKALLPVLVCGAALIALAAPAALGSDAGAASADAQRQADLALQQYAEVKTAPQRRAILDYLHELDRAAVVAAVVAHIEQAPNGQEATLFNGLIDGLRPESCAAVVQALRGAQSVEAKAKLVVALRHCQGPQAEQALAAALADRRAVAFEAHGKTPRRICDLAYDELFLKLRADPKYGLDAGAGLKGIIRESTPPAERDALIGKLSSKVGAAAPSPAPSATAKPLAHPVQAAPSAAAQPSPQPSR